MSRPLRIGVIGAGGNTRLKHIPGFQAIPGVTVAAVANRSRESGAKVAAEFGIGRVETDWRAIVDDPAIDAICIGTWPNLHAELTLAALRAGKHVLTEARMARDLGEAQAMVEEARRHPQLVAQIVPAPFSLPFDATIADWLAAGRLGTLREACLTCTNALQADPAGPLGWRQDFSLSGKNTMVMGIYYETLRRWLGRDPESVVADAAVFTPERRDAAGRVGRVSIPESLTILGRYADGARLIGHFSGVELGAPRAEIRVNGSEAGFRLDLAAGELWFTPRGGTEQKVVVGPVKRGEWRVEADFVESIREGRPVRLTDFATGLAYMRFTEAVWASWNAQGARSVLA